jgi:hypothetical protein
MGIDKNSSKIKYYLRNVVHEYHNLEIIENTDIMSFRVMFTV